MLDNKSNDRGALFCMTKYKSGLKAQIVHKYLSTFQSTNDLGEKHQISGRRIAEWVQRYQLKKRT